MAFKTVWVPMTDKEVTPLKWRSLDVEEKVLTKH